jgi:hypothetical protein
VTRAPAAGELSADTVLTTAAPIVQPCSDGVPSALPAPSIARTSNRWLALRRPE